MMDDKERLMLIGEQTLLEEERHRVQADQHAKLATLLTLYNEINGCRGQPRWLERGLELLHAIHATQTRLVELDTRINEVKKLTGR
jgi:hypothetical protein